MPNIELYPSRKVISIKERIIIGISDINGLKAILRPSLKSCFMVWETTRKSIGPGDKPAYIPNKIPAITISIIIIIYLLFITLIQFVTDLADVKWFYQLFHAVWRF